MSRIHRRLRALAFLFVLVPLWWLQRTHANPLSDSSSGGSHGHPAKPITPGGDDAARHDSGGGDSDDSDSDDNDGDDDDGHDGDDDDGHDGDDDDGNDGDDDDGGGITDCNNNGVDDAIDISSGTSADANHNGIPDECEFFVKTFCNGTGVDNGGVDCPCGNTVPSAPSGCANSTGSGASLQANGNALVSNDTVILTATGIPVGKAAYFLFGTTMIAGNPFGDGVRCLGQFRRLSKVSSSTGHDTFPPPNSLPISQQLGIVAGDTTLFQVIYRDATGPCHNGSNATNGVLIHWGP